MNNTENVSNKQRKELEKRLAIAGISKTKVADQAGVHPRTVYNFFSNKHFNESVYQTILELLKNHNQGKKATAERELELLESYPSL